LIRRQSIVLRRPYRAEQHSVTRQTRVERFRRQRRTEVSYRTPANGVLFELEPMPVNRRNRLQHAHRFRSDLWSNAVPWKNRNP
jgi:hypothetical protein